MVDFFGCAGHQETNHSIACARDRIRLARHPKRPKEPEILRREQLAHALFLLPTNPTIKGTTSSSVSVQSFVAYLEYELQQRVEHFYQPILDFCGFLPTNDVAQSTIRLVGSTADIMKRRVDRKISINKLICDVGKENGVDFDPKHLPPNVKQGMFSLLGFLTMLFEIPKDFSKEKLYLLRPVDPLVLYTRKPLDDTKIPMGVVIGSLGLFIPIQKEKKRRTLKDWPPKQPDSVDLNTSVLNAFTLTKIGKINIEWSELFSTHLMFDRNTRTLSLFRFPIFCALNCSRAGERTLFDQYVTETGWVQDLNLIAVHSIMDDGKHPESVLADANRSMFREALLSYRLLFGQEFNSRQLFRIHEKKRASISGFTDQLLVRLCGSSKDIADLTDSETLFEQAFYNSFIDFPHYGHRLEVLQKYVSARKSRNIKDLWQDRRDPERWALIWFVLILTVVTIVLSLVQIGLGARQVRLAQVQVELAKRALMDE
ncbi:MAG: hypothetical protein Q9204_002506 [Flavoplaca sp. TL-2023a]